MVCTQFAHSHLLLLGISFGVFCSKSGNIYTAILERFWNKLLRETVQSPFLDIFRICKDKALSNLV